MFTDNHCHILPRIDDGARDSKMALAMLVKMHSQGVDRVVATPHFYAHHEKSVEGFLKKGFILLQDQERIASSHKTGSGGSHRIWAFLHGKYQQARDRRHECDLA